MSLSDMLFANKPAYGTPPFAPTGLPETGSAQPARTGFGGFLDRVINPTSALGQFGKALIIAGGTPLGGAYQYMDHQREQDAEAQMRRAQFDAEMRRANLPRIDHVGNSIGITDQATGAFTPTYTAPEAPTGFERDLAAAGIDPASQDGQRLYRQKVEAAANPLMGVPGFDEQGRPTMTFVPRSGIMPGAMAPASPPVAPAPQATRPAPVGNARDVISELFPDARITDWTRDPNSPLGRANPGSWHNRSKAAVDVAPIPGMTFDQYTGRLKAAGYPLIEAIDEQKHPLPHTTGPNWHVVIGDKSGGGSPRKVASKAEFDALPSGTTFIAPDGTTRRKP